MLSFVGYRGGMSQLVDGDWRRLADYVLSARVALGFDSQAAFAEAIGVSEGSVRSLESGEPYTRRPVIMPKVEEALRWPAGTWRRILTGEIAGPPEPVPADLFGLPEEDARRYREELERSGDISERAKQYLLRRLFDSSD